MSNTIRIADAAANLAKNNDANRPAGAAAPAAPLTAATGETVMPALTGNPLNDLYNAIQSQGDKLIADLQAALALANYQLPGGSAVTVPHRGDRDHRALIPLVQLVIDGPPAATSGFDRDAGSRHARLVSPKPRNCASST